MMATKAEIQDLLRFLSRDAKMPLAQALSKVKPLQDAQLTSPSAIAQSTTSTLGTIFGSEAAAKPVLAAAKRAASRKRSADAAGSTGSTGSKRARTDGEPATADSAAAASAAPSFESSLALPDSDASVDELARTELLTNRAPLVLAFAVVSLECTMPRQPLSSRLSLAQAVVSANSRSKAQSIGLEPGRSAEDEGWGTGARRVAVLGRDIYTIKRVDRVDDEEAETPDASAGGRDSALWGLDLEDMRAKNSSAAPGPGAALPIHRPEAARAYLVKAFASLDEPEAEGATPKKKKKKSRMELEAEKEENCGRLLKAIRLLCDSWEKLAPQELDRRAWNWYVAVRPEVANGAAGWGGKNVVKLKDILDLRRLEDG